MLEKLYAYRRGKIFTTLSTKQWWYYTDANIYIPISITRIPHLNGVEFIDLKQKKGKRYLNSIEKWTPKEYRRLYGHKYRDGKWYWKGYIPFF